MTIRFLLFAAVLLSLTPVGAVAQFLDIDHLAAGQFVVATEKLGDPNFSQAVVLLVHYDASEGAIGIIVNRKTELTLAKIFPEKKAAADPVFEGGPVEIQVVQALIRSAAKPTKATALVDDVYVTASKTEIDKAISSHTEPSRFRAFLGYAGWAGGQLEDEIKIGAWSIVRATPKTIFDDDPDSLWDRLNRQANSQVAHLNFSPIRPARALSFATLRQ